MLDRIKNYPVCLSNCQSFFLLCILIMLTHVDILFLFISRYVLLSVKKYIVKFQISNNILHADHLLTLFSIMKIVTGREREQERIPFALPWFAILFRVSQRIYASLSHFRRVAETDVQYSTMQYT